MASLATHFGKTSDTAVAPAADIASQVAASQTAPMLQVSGITKSFGAETVIEDISFAVPKASTLVLLGPSGCGKTTLLRVIAGLERPDKGEVWRGDKLLTGKGTFVDVRHRRIGMVFQDLALFPHMSVYKNVSYGLPPRLRRNTEIVEEAIALVNLEGYEHRRPHQLSGGQQQRVALARALVPRPEVILFDEPFASLDTSLRIEVRSEVHELLHTLGTTAVFVTHDQEEAFVIGEEVVVISDKRIVQHDRPSVLYRQPVSPWVGLFVGHANMLSGKTRGNVASTCLGEIELLKDLGEATDAEVLVRPEHLQLTKAASANGTPGTPGSPNSHGIRASVELVEYHGHDTMYSVRLSTDSHSPDSNAPQSNAFQSPSPQNRDYPLLKVLVPGSSPQFDHGAQVNLSYIGPPATAFPA